MSWRPRKFELVVVGIILVILAALIIPDSHGARRTYQSCHLCGNWRCVTWRYEWWRHVETDIATLTKWEPIASHVHQWWTYSTSWVADCPLGSRWVADHTCRDEARGFPERAPVVAPRSP